MKVLLIQLPVQSHDYVYSNENIPLAAGYLKAYALQFLKDVDIEICPYEVASLAGDAAFVNWIEQRRPDLIGFSCYLWNIERSLYICREIRKRLPRVEVVLGGPEISEDNTFVLSSHDFDYAVVGEGEETFLELLMACRDDSKDLHGIRGLMCRTDGSWNTLEKRPLLSSLDNIPSPYLEGYIGLSPLKTIILETVRGCPYRCTFCYYHKTAPAVRCFSLERIRSEIEWAVNMGIEEVIILDPCLARRPGIDQLLCLFEEMQSVCPYRISCELNAEDLTPIMVDQLVRAGVSHVEIGLQSTNAKALKSVGRRCDHEAFMKGVGLLRDAGIHVVTDIMIGLPGDGLEDIKRSMDFVCKEGLNDDMNLYPLSVLPGTVLRSRAGRDGIIFQETPPYYVFKTTEIDGDGIREAFVYAHQITGIDYFPSEIPMPLISQHDLYHNDIIHHIVLDPEAAGDAVAAGCIGQGLSIEVRDPAWLDKKPAIEKALRHIFEENPFTLISWIIPEQYFRTVEDLSFILSQFKKGHHLVDREYMAAAFSMRSTQVFVVFADKMTNSVHAQMPVDGSRSPSKVFLPEIYDQEIDPYWRERLTSILGYMPEIHLYEQAGSDLEANLSMPLCTSLIAL